MLNGSLREAVRDSAKQDSYYEELDQWLNEIEKEVNLVSISFWIDQSDFHG